MRNAAFNNYASWMNTKIRSLNHSKADSGAFMENNTAPPHSFRGTSIFF